MLRTIATCLAVAALLAAPASAQVAIDRSAVAAAQPSIIAGDTNIAGVWHLTSPWCARLVLAKDAARRLTGSVRMGLCGAPGYNGEEMSCSGFQHANNQFQLVCTHPNGPFYVLMGRVVVDEPVLTQRRRAGVAIGGTARIEGRLHQAYFTGNPEPAYLIDHALTGARGS
jgi:hypothetical protein